jgi:hypothetical protein
MKIKKTFALFALFLTTASFSQGATIAFDNLTALGDAAHGIRDANGVLVSGVSFSGALGRFTISNSAISSSFASNDFAAIQAGFQQFDPVGGSFALDTFEAGAFSANEVFNTKNSVVPGYGGSTVYAVFYKGATISGASELFVAELNTTFPTDPEVGAAASASFSIRPSTVANLVVGSVGAPHDFGIGGGAQSTFQLANPVPEPSRLVFLGFGLIGIITRRRR